MCWPPGWIGGRRRRSDAITTSASAPTACASQCTRTTFGRGNRGDPAALVAQPVQASVVPMKRESHGVSVLVTDVHFRLQLITGPNEEPRFADVLLTLRDTDNRSTRTEMRVSVEPWNDPDVP